MAEKTNANIGFEKEIWDAACVLWGHIPAAEYRQVVVGLIFLRYVSTNKQVIKELLKLAEDIRKANSEGEDLGLTHEEVAFYDALTRPAAIHDFYSNEQLVMLTKELTEALRRNKTIDWQKREGARSSMKMLVKRLLKKYKYPPEGFDDAVQTVLTQCELWTDNTDM